MRKVHHVIATPTMSARRLAAAGLSALLALALLVPLGTANAQVPTSPPNPTATPTPDTATSKRLKGEGRFETAAAIAADAFPNGADNVIIARGDTFPDALAGSFLAGVRQGPILLTSTDELPEGTQRGLDKINRKAYVLGGPTAISETVVTQLKAEGLEVERIAGESRYDTARRIAISGGIEAGDMGDQSRPAAPNGSRLPANTAFLVTGDSFADALAAGPFAYWGKHPVILTRSDVLSDEAKAVIQDETLKIAQVIIVGGRKAVSAVVEDQVKALQKAVTRVSGATRDETASKLADFYVTNQVVPQGGTRVGYSEINLALGQNFPDALALGPRGGKTNSVILLSQTPEQLGDVTRAFIGSKCDPADTIVVAGGESAIDAATAEAATQAAICGTASNFTITPVKYARIYGETHEVIVSVKDASGQGVPNVFIKVDVYRSDRPTPPEQFEPATPPNESKTGKTAADGTLKVTYTYAPSASPSGTPPPDRQSDRIVACAHPRESFPSPCLGEKEFNANMLLAEAAATWYRDAHRLALTGDAVAPGPGNEEAEGTAVVAFITTDPDGDPNTPAVSELCWMIDIKGLEDKATGAHIHKGPVGEAGAIAVTLVPAPDQDGFAMECAKTANYASGMSPSARLKEIKDRPQDFYIDVHNTEFPEGALRGQIKAS